MRWRDPLVGIVTIANPGWRQRTCERIDARRWPRVRHAVPIHGGNPRTSLIGLVLGRCSHGILRVVVSPDRLFVEPHFWGRGDFTRRNHWRVARSRRCASLCDYRSPGRLLDAYRCGRIVGSQIRRNQRAQKHGPKRNGIQKKRQGILHGAKISGEHVGDWRLGSWPLVSCIAQAYFSIRIVRWVKISAVFAARRIISTGFRWCRCGKLCRFVNPH
jgi:hypothetical protein